MKVLQINSVCKKGSTGKIAYDLHTQLIKNGHKSSICYGRGDVVQDKYIYKFSSNLGVNLHALIARVIGINGLASNFSTNKLFKYIEKFNPDVVHLHNIHGYYINAYRLLNYLKKKNIKTIITLHDDWMFTGNCGYSYECEKWIDGCGKCKSIQEYPKSMLFDFSRIQHSMKIKSFKKFNNLTIVTPSQWLADRAKKSFLGDKEIKVIHNGIDTENVFYPSQFEDIKKKHDIKNEKIILAVTPNFSDERKGGKYIIELARLLERDNVDLKIIVIGSHEIVEDAPSNLIFLPRTENQSELSKYYSMADIFVITSICENFPTVCLEALACNTYVVGFDAGGTKETAPAGCGEFVQLKDVEHLKEVILNKLNSNFYEKDDSCIEYAKENYDIQGMYNKYYELYHNE